MKYLNKRKIKELFRYTKQEVRGIIVLVLLIFVAIILPDLYSLYNGNDCSVSDLCRLDSLEVVESDDLSVRHKLIVDSIVVKESEDVISEKINLAFKHCSDGKKLELKGKYASLNNSRISKVSTFNREKRHKRERIDDKKTKFKKKYISKRKSKSRVLIELNSADTTELKRVYGIGSWYSRKIVRYRERLGGFFSVTQLREIRMREGTYERISPQLYVDTTNIRRINLDTIGFKNLLRHPYFDYPMVKKVFNLRRKDKNIISKDLLDNEIVSSSQYRRIKRYCQ